MNAVAEPPRLTPQGSAGVPPVPSLLHARVHWNGKTGLGHFHGYIIEVKDAFVKVKPWNAAMHVFWARIGELAFRRHTPGIVALLEPVSYVATAVPSEDTY